MHGGNEAKVVHPRRLAGVTFVDAEGQACLVGLHRQAAELVAADCLTKAVVDEITRGSSSMTPPSELMSAQTIRMESN